MNIDAQFHLEQLSDFRRIIMVSAQHQGDASSHHSIIQLNLPRFKYPYRSIILAINAVNYRSAPSY